MRPKKPDGTVLRIIDANTNRLKEGLRVCEDIFRFILNDKNIARQLKEIRHEADALVDMLAGINQRIACRDSRGDTGRTFHTKAELRRSGMVDLLQQTSRG